MTTFDKQDKERQNGMMVGNAITNAVTMLVESDHWEQHTDKEMEEYVMKMSEMLCRVSVKLKDSYSNPKQEYYEG